MNRYILPGIAVALIAGCSADAPDEPPAVENDNTETVFDPLTESLERARAVDELAKKRKSDIEAKLEAESGGTAPD